MSRGLGKVERDIIEYLQKLDKKGMPTRIYLSMFCRMIYEPSPMALILGQPNSYSKEYSSLKRASKSLERKGLIKRWSNARCCIVELVKCTPQRDTLKQEQNIY